MSPHRFRRHVSGLYGKFHVFFDMLSRKLKLDENTPGQGPHPVPAPSKIFDGQ